MSSSQQVKYACIVFSLPFPFPEVSTPFNFDQETELITDSIKSQIEGPDSKHWSEWLGSLTWEALSQNQLLLSTWAKTINPNVLDQENQDLQNKVSTIFRILPLIAPLCPSFEDVYLLSGKGIISDSKILIKDIRTFSRVNLWTRSYYNEHYWNEFHDWATASNWPQNFLNDWLTIYQKYENLFIQKKTNRQLFESYRSFDEAMRGTQLEFKMPNLIRAIECVVDCWGYKQFAERTLFLTGVPDPTMPYQIATNTKELLQDLYQLRNDCSHGKPFAYSLEKRFSKSPGGSTVAKYEFLAEWAARKILTTSFTNPSLLQHSSDRDTLVNAWKKNLVKVTWAPT